MKPFPDIIDLYEEKADYWLRSRAASPFFEKKYLDWLVEQLKPASKILDLGCGDGWPIASYLAEKGFKVTGIDGAKKMIERAKKRLPDQSWFNADMRTIDLNEKFQAIVAWDSFFHLTREDQSKMFAIFQKHSDSRAYLLFTSGPENGEAIGNLDGRALYHSSLAPHEYRALFATHGLEEVAYDPEDKDCGGHTVWRCRLAR